MSPRPPPSPPKSIDFQLNSRIRPHDSVQDLSERLNNWRMAVTESRAEEQPQLSRKTSLRTEHMTRSPQPPVPNDVLVVGAGPAGLMLA